MSFSHQCSFLPLKAIKSFLGRSALIGLLLALEEDAIAGALITQAGDRFVVNTAGAAGQMGGRDVYGFRPGVDSTARPLLTGEHDQTAIALSPDNRWLAYASSESGRYEVRVRPFPSLKSEWQVSAAGGTTPLWAHNGRELFYITPANEMVAASVETDPAFSVTERRVLFELGPEFVREMTYAGYDISPDDRRFLMVRNVGPQEETVRQLVLVENWFEELKELVGNEGRR